MGSADMGHRMGNCLGQENCPALVSTKELSSCVSSTSLLYVVPAVVRAAKHLVG